MAHDPKRAATDAASLMRTIDFAKKTAADLQTWHGGILVRLYIMRINDGGELELLTINPRTDICQNATELASLRLLPGFRYRQLEISIEAAIDRTMLGAFELHVDRIYCLLPLELLQSGRTDGSLHLPYIMITKNPRGMRFNPTAMPYANAMWLSRSQLTNFKCEPAIPRFFESVRHAELAQIVDRRKKVQSSQLSAAAAHVLDIRTLAAHQALYVYEADSQGNLSTLVVPEDMRHEPNPDFW